jgi:hypothetical protein
MRKKYNTKLILGIFSFVLLTSNAFAYKPFNPRLPIRDPKWCGDTPPATTSAPFDGGISLLIAAGVGYACKKGYDKRRLRKEGQKIDK